MKRSNDAIDQAQNYLEILKERQRECLACKEGDCSQIKHDCVDLELVQEIEDTELEIQNLLNAKVGRVCEACEQEVLNQAGHIPACDSLSLPSFEAVGDAVGKAVGEVVNAVVDAVLDVVEAVQQEAKSQPKEVVDLSEDKEDLSVAEEVALEFPRSNSPVYHD